MKHCFVEEQPIIVLYLITSFLGKFTNFVVTREGRWSFQRGVDGIFDRWQSTDDGVRRLQRQPAHVSVHSLAYVM